MAVINHSLGHPTPVRRSWWSGLLGAVAWYGRVLEVVAAVERARPYERRAIVWTWLRETQ